MALSDDLRKRVVEAVVLGGLSRNQAAAHFKVSVASAVRWVRRRCPMSTCSRRRTTCTVAATAAKAAVYCLK